MSVGIIGAGPGGISAAIQLARYRIKSLLFEKQSVGGLLHCASRLENIPGFPDGIDHSAFIERLCRHMDRNDIHPIFEKITSVAFSGGTFKLKSTENTYFTSHLIIASGTVPIQHPLIRNKIDLAPLVSFDSIALRKTRGKNVVVLGAGDAAFDYALSIAPRHHVMILNRRDHIRCLPLLKERVFRQSHIKIMENTVITDIEKCGDQLELFIESNRKNRRISCHHLICAIGRKPDLSFIPQEFPMRMLKSSGLLFLIGDVKNGMFRQASIALGDGMKAAMALTQSSLNTREKSNEGYCKSRAK